MGQNVLAEIVAWLPMIVFLGGLVYFVSRTTFGKNNEYLAELQEETKRHNQTVEQILKQMSDRIERLERTARN